MKVFISWSGERSEALANALYEWLPMVLHFVEPWLSKSDIEPGERWSNEIAKELEETNFGILCITKENLNSSWILFEAGALAKQMQNAKVIPLLLDVDFQDISGPLSQFQAKKADRNGIKLIVESLNKYHTAPIPDRRLESLLENLYNNLHVELENIPMYQGPGKPTKPTNEVIEELVAEVRNLQFKFKESFTEEDISVKRTRNIKKIKFGYSHLIEFVQNPEISINDPVKLLLLSSTLKEDFPWIFELTSQIYNAYTVGKSDLVRLNLLQLYDLSKLTWVSGYGEGHPMLEFFRRELDLFIRQNESKEELMEDDEAYYRNRNRLRKNLKDTTNFNS